MFRVPSPTVGVLLVCTTSLRFETADHCGRRELHSVGGVLHREIVDYIASFGCFRVEQGVRRRFQRPRL